MAPVSPLRPGRDGASVCPEGPKRSRVISGIIQGIPQGRPGPKRQARHSLDTSSYAGAAVLVGFLLLLLAFFWGAETALFAANRLRLRHLEEKGSASARIALALFQRPARLLSTVLISN